jgi:hypothetical protein
MKLIVSNQSFLSRLSFDVGKYGRKKLIVGTILLILISFLILYNSFYAWMMINKLQMNDFGKIYYSTIEFLENRDMYGPNPSTLMKINESTTKQFWNLNLPHFHLLLLPIAFLPPKVALAIWGWSTLFCLIISLGLIAREMKVKVTPLRFLTVLSALLALAGTSTVLVTGQISIWLMLPMTLCWLEARKGRWTVAGIYLGLVISLKPFLLIFIPYLLLRRKYLAVVSAGAVIALLFTIGFLIFGLNSYASWMRAILSMDWTWVPMNGSIKGFLARIFAESPYYAKIIEYPSIVLPIYIGSVFLIGIPTMVFTVHDHSDHSVDRNFALLQFSALLISPVGFTYYTWLPLGPLIISVYFWFLKNWKGNFLVSMRVNWLKIGMLLVASLGLIFPLPLTLLFQPLPFATFTFGSIYFWGFLSLWAFLILDSYTCLSKPIFDTSRYKWIAKRL